MSKRFARSIQTLILVLVPLIVQAQVRPSSVNLPAQSLAESLRALGSQVNVNVLVSPELVQGKKAPALSGSYTFEGALRELLANSGLKYEFIAERTVSITAARGGNSTSTMSPADQMRVAVGDRNTDDESSGKEDKDSKDPQQVVVKGEREKMKPFSGASIDLQRTEDDVLPFQTFTAEEIRRSGAMDLAEFFRARLSQNYQGYNEQRPSPGTLRQGDLLGAANGLSFANGAGNALGPTEIVILMNGRRLPGRFWGDGIGSASKEPQSVAEFRSIPIASIERVELLSSAASALYGAGATGAVINVITRQDYKGGTIAMGYSNPADGHAPNRNIDLSYGTPLRYGINLRASYSFSDSQPLSVGDRADLVYRLRGLTMERQPAKFMLEPPLGTTPNVQSASGAGLFGPGTPSFVSSPEGYAGGNGIQPFLSRAGVYNLDLADGFTLGSPGKSAPLGASNKIINYAFGLDKVLGKSSRFTLEYRRTESELAGGGSNITGIPTTIAYYDPVLASAPGNPFGQDVAVTWYDRRLDELDYERFLTAGTENVTASLRTDIAKWSTIVDVAYLRDTDAYGSREFYSPALGGTFSSWAAVANAGLYNPFVDTRTIAPAAPSFYEEYLQQILSSGGTTQVYQATMKGSGPIWTLPGGDVALTAGLEWSHQKRNAEADIPTIVNTRTGAILDQYVEVTNDPPVDVTYSAYSELLLPLISTRNRKVWASKLDFFASGRISRNVRDGSSVVGSTFVTNGPFTHQVLTTIPARYETRPFLYLGGFRYDMVEGIALRSSLSMGYRPPTFSQTVPSAQSSSNQTVIDRRTGLSVVLTPAMRMTGGNPELKPESTDSMNIGVVIQPKWWKSFRLSVDYVRGVRNDAIAGLTPQVVLDLEATEPDIAARVTRNTAGAIALIDARNINFRGIESKEIDFAAEKTFEVASRGNLVLTAAATKNISLKVQASAAGAGVEQVRNPVSSFGAQVVKWNGNVQVRWENEKISVGWSTRFLDCIFVRPADQQLQGDDRIASALDHDMFFSYRFLGPGSGISSSIFSGLTVTAGVKNVFDRTPRFDASDTDLGAVGVDSLYGRNLWMQLTKQF